MIDLGIYDGLFRMIEWQIPFYEKLGIDAQRNGASFPFEGAFVTEICPAQDDAFVVVSAATTTTIEKLIGFLRDESEYTLPRSNSTEASVCLPSWVANTAPTTPSGASPRSVSSPVASSSPVTWRTTRTSRPAATWLP